MVNQINHAVMVKTNFSKIMQKHSADNCQQQQKTLTDLDLMLLKERECFKNPVTNTYKT